MSKRIGVMLVTIDQYYQKDLWKGLQTYGKDNDIVFYFFCGSPFEAPQIDFSHYNSIYNLINTNLLDGMIITTGTLGNYVGTKVLYEYLKMYGDIPNLSLSVDYPEMLVVRQNNRESMERLVDHIIEAHQYTDIALISGPMTNSEAVERLEGFKDSLEKHGMTFDPTNVVEGRFNSHSGGEAVRKLYKENNKRPQIIVSANDDMAIGAFFELKKLGVEVGKDVFIVGYDDLQEVSYFNPPFTTVKLPLFEMGQKAAELISDKIDGKAVDRVVDIEGEVIVRESCGCLNVLPFEPSPEIDKILTDLSHESDDELDFERWFLSHSKTFIEIISNSLSSESYRTLPETVLDLMVDFRSDIMKNRVDGMFLKRFNALVQRFIHNGIGIDKWKYTLYMVKQYLLRGPISKERLLVLDDIFYLANTILSNTIIRDEKHKTYTMIETYYDTSNLIAAFHTVMDLDSLVDVLEDWLDKIDLELFSLCLFEEVIEAVNNGQFPYPKIMTALYTKNGEEITCNYEYESDDMMPTDLFDTYKSDYVFFPIHFKNRHFGYIITSTESAENLIFKKMREQIGTTLDRINTYKQLESYNKELEKISVMDSLTGLYNHRGFYERGTSAQAESLRNKSEMTIVYGDLDKLKQINDKFGHQEGDYAIATIGLMFRNIFEYNSFAGRVGGDEFVVVIIGIESLERAGRFIDAMEEALLLENSSNGKGYHINISFGVKAFSGYNKMSFEERINEADMELYRVKKALKSKKG